MKERHLELVDLERNPMQEIGPAQYAEAMTPDIIHLYQDLGLAPEFLPILGRHLRETQVGLPAYDTGPSTLSVGSNLGPDGKSEFYRQAVLSRKQLTLYENVLRRTLASFDIHPEALDNEPKSSSKVNAYQQGWMAPALDWIFYELSADAAANSCYMQHRYNKYIPDLNGQADIFAAQYTISRVFHGKYSEGDEVNSYDMARDHKDFRAGIALLLLKDQLLRTGIVEHEKKAAWIIESIAQNYPPIEGYSIGTIQPLDMYQVIDRLISVAPREDVEKSLAEYVLLFAERGNDEDEV